MLLEIDLQGAPGKCARRCRRHASSSSRTVDELVRRLVGRGTEDEAERERRLATARVELAAECEFDHVIVNDDVHRARPTS